AVDNPTLNRFYALHYLMPFLIAGVVILHIWALHVPGNNNPSGVEVKDVKKDTLPFHPYYTVKDGFAIIVFLILFAAFIFYMPNSLGHPDNYIPADPLVTPAHIVPEWYFLPFYAMLRAVDFNFLFIDAKLGGVIVMVASIMIWFVLPWLDRSKVRSMRYRPIAKPFFWVMVAAFLLLGWLGAQPAEGIYVVLSKLATLYYFVYFLVVLPLLSVRETPLPLPTSISEAVLQDKGKPKEDTSTPVGGVAPAPAE
ncbi:MAG: cytochrome b N-terminal domain-containing protein, partial [Pseudomonadota bacterium]